MVNKMAVSDLQSTIRPHADGLSWAIPATVRLLLFKLSVLLTIRLRPGTFTSIASWSRQCRLSYQCLLQALTILSQ